MHPGSGTRLLCVLELGSHTLWALFSHLKWKHSDRPVDLRMKDDHVCNKLSDVPGTLSKNSINCIFITPLLPSPTHPPPYTPPDCLALLRLKKRQITVSGSHVWARSVVLPQRVPKASQLNTKIKLSLFRFYFNQPTKFFIRLCLSETLQLMAGKSDEQPLDVLDSWIFCCWLKFCVTRSLIPQAPACKACRAEPASVWFIYSSNIYWASSMCQALDQLGVRCCARLWTSVVNKTSLFSGGSKSRGESDIYIYFFKLQHSEEMQW